MTADHLPTLSSAEVHVWTFPLTSTAIDMDEARGLLDPLEQIRLARLRLPKNGRRFLMAHVGLRLLLSHYCGRSPEEIRYRHGTHGKPELEPEHPCHFNLSHSSDLALVAVSHKPVGVDLERIDPGFLHESVAERYFSPQEAAVLRSLAKETRLESFYVCWTRKEAYLKACGAGFSIPSECFDVSFTPGNPPALLHHKLDDDEPLRWNLHELLLPEGFRGAVATSAGQLVIRQFTGIWGTPPLTRSPP